MTTLVWSGHSQICPPEIFCPCHLVELQADSLLSKRQGDVLSLVLSPGL